jgi:ubiquitin carboxyl-terminal hydrolase 22/27/51
MDLSLDVKSAGVVVKKKKLALTGAIQTVKEQIPVDLVECLDRYTSVETLSSDSYTCRKCEGPKEAKKKLTLTRLPPVIPIHLKRFAHTKSSKESQKIDTRVRFPFRLDLSPYATPLAKSPAESALEKANGTGKDRERKGEDHDDDDDDDGDGDGDTISVKRRRTKAAGAEGGEEGEGGEEEEEEEEEGVAPDQAMYELSSVVVHKGKMDSGHYISYSKQEQQWFRFDDSMVVQVDEKEVLNAEAYMLFYVVAEL